MRFSIYTATPHLLPFGSGIKKAVVEVKMQIVSKLRKEDACYDMPKTDQAALLRTQMPSTKGGDGERCK